MWSVTVCVRETSGYVGLSIRTLKLDCLTIDVSFDTQSV